MTELEGNLCLLSVFSGRCSQSLLGGVRYLRLSIFDGVCNYAVLVEISWSDERKLES